MNRVLNVASLVTLIAGLALSLYGLGQLPWPSGFPDWSAYGLVRYSGFIALTFGAIVIGARISANTPLMIAFMCAIALALLANAIWALVAAICIAAAAAIIGHSILTKLGRSALPGQWLISLLVGIGSMGTIIGLIAHFPVSYPGLYGLIVALPVALGHKRLQELLCRQLRWANTVSDRSEREHLFLDASVGAVALVYISVALAPEVAHDALAMHLFIPAHLAQRHQWGFDASTYVWAVMPMLGDWIFSLAYMLAGEPATRLLNVGFIFLVGCLIRQLVEWAGGSQSAGRLAVLIYLSAPLTFTEGSSLFIESIWAAFLVGGTLDLLRAIDDRSPEQTGMISAGLLFGLALATKAITLTVLPVLMLVLLLRYRAWLGPAFPRNGAIGLCLFVGLGAIPYVTAWWLTGNPVFPFLNKVFQSPLYPPVNFDSATVFGKGLSWDVLYRTVFQSEKYLEAKPGAPGFHYLALLVPALLVLARARHIRALLLAFIAVASIAITFQSVSYLRYVFPASAILTATIGVALSTEVIDNSKLRKFLIGGATFAILANLAFIVAGSRYGDFPLRALLSDGNTKAYLLERQPTRLAVELINKLNTSQSPVAVFAQPMTAGLSGDGLYPSWYNNGFQRMVESANTSETLASALIDRGVEYVILDHGGVPAPRLQLIEGATDTIATFNNVTVRRIGKAFSFRRELLENPQFSSVVGWTLVGEAQHDRSSATLTASAESPAFQGVKVTPRKKYLNKVIARCKGTATQGRVQVNWASPNNRFIGTEIRVFNCSDTWTEHSMEVISPPEATSAVVYATGHSTTPLEIQGVSFRQ